VRSQKLLILEFHFDFDEERGASFRSLRETDTKFSNNDNHHDRLFLACPVRAACRLRCVSTPFSSAAD
jgi:hypothetical protein